MLKESEKGTEQFLFREMRILGGSANKFVCPNHRGKPDRICVFPKGLVIFVELKSEGKKLKDHQAREHQRMRAQGLIVCTLDTRAKVLAFIKHYQELDNAFQLSRSLKSCERELRKSKEARVIKR